MSCRPGRSIVTYYESGAASTFLSIKNAKNRRKTPKCGSQQTTVEKGGAARQRSSTVLGYFQIAGRLSGGFE
jgi:hypothetical protein